MREGEKKIPEEGEEGRRALAESGQTKRYVLIPPVLTSKTAGSSAQLALHSTAPDWGLCVLAPDVQAVITAFRLLFSHQTLRHCGDGNGRQRRGAKPVPKTKQDHSKRLVWRLYYPLIYGHNCTALFAGYVGVKRKDAGKISTVGPSAIICVVNA